MGVDQSEVSRILSNLSSMPGHTTTGNKALAAELVGHDFLFCNGELRYIRAKHLGAGVYRIYTEED